MVRALSDIEINKTAYNQHALVASIETAIGQQSITWQRFLPTGPQAFLPLSGSRGSIVWYHNPDEVKRLVALSEEAFLAELEEAFPKRLGQVLKVYKKASFPLFKSHAKEYVKNRIALVGDAAHSIHPQAGQGVNIGLMDAATLADVILQAHKSHADIGKIKKLRKYERIRRGNNALMINTMDAFYHSFKEQPKAFKVLRSAALTVANNCSPIKNVATQYAMGLSGDLPNLAKGKMPG
jgi:2-octaprenyl-3-methyl-6-methoxy-1,4-benzoquinol hydroxylase